MLFDAFISHASEDKETFVRGLSEALREKNVAVWYDEFSLRVGDSLRRSIDQGLTKSRFGIVILSKAFIGKKWPEWELDGLVQRQNSSQDPVILPVWFDISYEDVMAFSPPLADKFAIRAEKGLKYVVDELLKVIKPQGSSLVVARERLIAIGYHHPPVVTDDWWHRPLEYSGSNPMEGSFQEAMGWGHWGFPLPPTGNTALEKGERIAWAALQLNWQEKANTYPISQISRPKIVHDFINSTPGLQQACLEYPHYLSTYAPQLTIPGCGGEFESVFDTWLENSRKKQKKQKEIGSKSGTGLTLDGNVPTCDEPIALHDPTFGNYESAHIACFFVQGDLMGPPVKVYDTIDYTLWFLSDESNWVPPKMKQFLIDGLKKWAVWPWSEFTNESDFPSNSSTGTLQKSLSKMKSPIDIKLTNRIHKDIDTRFDYSINILKLPDSVAILKERFFCAGFIEEWYRQRHLKRKK